MLCVLPPCLFSSITYFIFHIFAFLISRHIFDADYAFHFCHIFIIDDYFSLHICFSMSPPHLFFFHFSSLFIFVLFFFFLMPFMIILLIVLFTPRYHWWYFIIYFFHDILPFTLFFWCSMIFTFSFIYMIPFDIISFFFDAFISAMMFDNAVFHFSFFTAY